jgi:uncharacterized protein YhdP
MTEQHPNFSMNSVLALLYRMFRSIWRFSSQWLFGLIIALAAILLVLRTTAFFLEQNPGIIEDLIEERLNIRIEFDSLKIRIGPLYSAIEIEHLLIHQVNDNKVGFEFPAAKLSVKLLDSLLHQKLSIDSLSISGEKARLYRDKSGDFYLEKLKLTGQAGADSSKQANKDLLQFIKQSHFNISFDNISFYDEMLEYPELKVKHAVLLVSNEPERHQVILQAKLDQSETWMDVRLDFTGALKNFNNWDGKIYLELINVNEQTALRLLQQPVFQIEQFQFNNITADLRAWSYIRSGKLQAIQGELKVDDASLERLDRKQKIEFADFFSYFSLRRLQQPRSYPDRQTSAQLNVWQIDLFDTNLRIDDKAIREKRIKLEYHLDKTSQKPEFDLYLNTLDLQEIAHVVSFFSPVRLDKQIIRKFKPEGVLNDTYVHLTLDALTMPVNIEDYEIYSDIHNFGINDFHKIPKVRNLSAKLLMNKNRGKLAVNSQNLKLHIKHLLREQWPATQINGDFFWQKEMGQWLFAGDDVKVSNTHLKAKADMKFWLDSDFQIYMDLNAYYHAEKVKYAPYYYPVTIMDKSLVKWLDESIKSGVVTDGGIVFRGQLNQFPFRDNSGVLDIVFNTDDVELEYQPGWPKLKEIQSEIQFTEKGMLIESDHVKVKNSVSKNISVAIRTYEYPMLSVTGKVKSNVKDGVAFLKESKLATNKITDMLHAKGNIDIGLDLSIPLHSKIKKPINSKVSIYLKGLDYYPPAFDDRKQLVKNLKGKVVVHNEAIMADSLSANIMGKPANIQIKTKTRKGEHDTRIIIRSPFEIKRLQQLKLIPEAFEHYAAFLSGESNMTLEIVLPGKTNPFSVMFYSDLEGIYSSLPIPMKKRRNSILPVTVKFSDVQKNSVAKNSVSQMNIHISDELTLVMLFDSHKDYELLKGHLSFGRKDAQIPEKRVFKVSGSFNHIPIEPWQSLFTESGQQMNSASTGKALLPIELDMTEVKLPAPNSKQKQHEAEASKTTQSSMSPASFPLINGSIKTVKLGDANFGKFTIKSSRIDKGIIFDQLSLKGPLMNFSGNGKWHQWTGDPKVDIEGSIKIPDVEQFLVQLGYDISMRKGELSVDGFISWPGSLGDFSLESLEGNVSFIIHDGAYLESKLGPTGRVLGLLNTNELQRRFSMDFSDVSDKGFNFDVVQGDVRLLKGSIYSDNVKMEAPSAKILIDGQINFTSKELEQRVTVIPEVSATLPLAGAAVAGPAGAAVVWVGQKILGDEINKATAFDYQVSGSWESPEIQRVKISRKTLEKLKQLLNVEKANTNNDPLQQSDLP